MRQSIMKNIGLVGLLFTLGIVLAACGSPAPATPMVVTRLVMVSSVPDILTPAQATATAPPAPTTVTTVPATPTATARPRRPAHTPQALVIHLFTASPEVIDPGEPVELSWEVSGGKVVIHLLDSLGRMTMDSYEVPLKGTRTFSTSAQARNEVEFYMSVIDAAGNQAASARLAVPIRCPDGWFFANGPTACPRPAETGRAAGQHFEHGMMIWLESQDYIYAFYSDSQWPTVERWKDNFEEGQPEADPSLAPPPGLFQPIRGFGAIWREKRGSTWRVRDRLGWATDREAEIPGVFQCEAAPRYATCYMGGPDNSVIVLRPNISGWAYWN